MPVQQRQEVQALSWLSKGTTPSRNGPRGADACTPRRDPGETAPARKAAGARPTDHLGGFPGLSDRCRWKPHLLLQKLEDLPRLPLFLPARGAWTDVGRGGTKKARV